MQKRRLSFILAAGMLAAIIPAAVSAAPPERGCPDGWTFGPVELADALPSVGNFADQNGDGSACAKMTNDGMFVWKDNTSPFKD